MVSYPVITLKKGKEKSVLNFHPWIFSGALQKNTYNLPDGELVAVASSDQKWLGVGMYHHASIAIRMLSFTTEPINEAFWYERLKKAYDMRQQLGLINNSSTTAFRLVHGEGDGLSGLIIDIYHTTAIIQCHVAGMFRMRNEISRALNKVFNNLESIYDKSDESFFTENDQRHLKGNKNEDWIKENNLLFNVNWAEGQKTGFFNDQRDNRLLLQKYCPGKKVINLFAYSGGFSVYALAAGASMVHSVDSSAKAAQWAEKNIAANHLSNHTFFCTDVNTFLKDHHADYDIWIVDPPAFAKRLDAISQAMIGYRRLNTQVFKQAKKGSFVFTFSCSQAIDPVLFRKIIFQSARESNRIVRILHILSQPPDHPISVFHPEGEYLKGLALYIE